MFSGHDDKGSDPYLSRPFSAKERLIRFIWGMVYWTLFRWTTPSLHNWRCFLLTLFGAQLGDKNFIYPSSKIWAPWLLRTGNIVTIGPDSEVYNPGGVELGHHAIVSQGAYLCGATHDFNSQDFTYLKKPITIEAYSWICARAIVMPGINCSEGSVLGAGAVLTRDMEPWSVYAGNPARKVSGRNNFLREGRSNKNIEQ